MHWRNVVEMAVAIFIGWDAASCVMEKLRQSDDDIARDVLQEAVRDVTSTHENVIYAIRWEFKKMARDLSNWIWHTLSV